MSSEMKLKPCPFCGAPTALTDTMPSGAYWCHCTICECEGPASSKDAATAVEAWNRRTAAPQPAPAGEVVAYDAGLLNDWGGGNVEWWQDYIRAELGRAHDFYSAQITTPPTTDADADAIRRAALEEVVEIAEAEKRRCRARGAQAEHEGNRAKEDLWMVCGDTAGVIADQILALAMQPLAK